MSFNGVRLHYDEVSSLVSRSLKRHVNKKHRIMQIKRSAAITSIKRTIHRVNSQTLFWDHNECLKYLSVNQEIPVEASIHDHKNGQTVHNEWLKYLSVNVNKEIPAEASIRDHKNGRTVHRQ